MITDYLGNMEDPDDGLNPDYVDHIYLGTIYIWKEWGWMDNIDLGVIPNPEVGYQGGVALIPVLPGRNITHAGCMSLNRSCLFQICAY